jgi:hypothetical protein
VATGRAFGAHTLLTRLASDCHKEHRISVIYGSASPTGEADVNIATSTEVISVAVTTLKLLLEEGQQQQEEEGLGSRLSKLWTLTKIAILSELQKLDNVMLSAGMAAM